MVNGSISGATDIDVTRDISIGNKIRFSDFTTITTGDGGIEIQAWNGIDLVGRVEANELYSRGKPVLTTNGEYSLEYSASLNGLHFKDRFGSTIGMLEFI